MSGKLFVIGTPIGNLSDITFRAVKTLGEVDFIAAEDTRVSLKLLSHFGIKKPVFSYHEHSTKYVEDSLVARIVGGESCGVITDAGMPCISDPGEDLVASCVKAGVEVVVIPGPSAVVSALAISGLPTKRFAFEGFLSTSKKQRFEHLESVKSDTHTLIFYEAPHKLLQTLCDMLDSFGDREISLCREITKLHEEVIRTNISGAIDYYADKTPRGEYVLVLKGREKLPEDELTPSDAVLLAQRMIADGKKATDACKEVAKLTGLSKSELYAMIQGLNT